MLDAPDTLLRRKGVDGPRVERAVREFLLAVGEDPDRPGLADTPARVARAAVEMYGGLHEDPATVLDRTFDLGHEELVLVKDIPFYSTCEHHLVPFHGVAHVGYIPSADGVVTGLSKLARLVDVFARRPQVQERLTTQVVDALVAVPPAPGGDCSGRVRASLHVHARRPEAGGKDHHFGRPRGAAAAGSPCGGTQPDPRAADRDGVMAVLRKSDGRRPCSLIYL